VEDIEEREDAGTPPIIQKIKAALAFWVKEYIGHDTIERWEHFYIENALKRLLSNPNIGILGNTKAKRQAVLSFLVYTTTCSTSADISPEGDIDGNDITGLYLWRETGNKRDKPLHGPFVAKLLNDLFGIQARGGCACAGPYGHSLLKVDESQSLAFKSAIEMVRKNLSSAFTYFSVKQYI
jgi:selenocysteine lyase/cysteine desulfurase